jgi:shikimate 5-dehydrogenase
VRALTANTLRPAESPTIYFIGVTTGSSSIQSVFPLWADALDLGDAVLTGIDLPLHAPAEDYRRVVEFIANDEFSLGALVTTHKIDLYQAASDMFDVRDAFSVMMGETSCLSKTSDGLVCHAKDPISSGLALDAFVPVDYWSQTGAQMLSMGAGGSTIAISWFLSNPERGADRPASIIVSNRSPGRLHHLEHLVDSGTISTDTPFEFVIASDPRDNDEIVSRLAPGSLIVNATGLGKDAPGSPLTGSAPFPHDGLAWELNYRGDLLFLDQARAPSSRLRHVEDGWTYFLHGWTQVIGEVFHVSIPTSGGMFDELSRLATVVRR